MVLDAALDAVAFKRIQAARISILDLRHDTLMQKDQAIETTLLQRAGHTLAVPGKACAGSDVNSLTQGLRR